MAPTQRHIEKLESGSLRVRVYAGHGKLLRIAAVFEQTIFAGPGARDRAEQVRAEFLEQVRVGSHPRSDATSWRRTRPPSSTPTWPQARSWSRGSGPR